MKVVKILAVVLAVVLLAGFVCIMFLPIDTFVAKRSAGFKGYDVPTSYTGDGYLLELTGWTQGSQAS